MSIFKESTHEKQVDDSMEIVNDFTRQVPFWDYRPVNYRVDDHFLNLYPEIDAYLARLFAGEIDDGNGDVLDNLICDHAVNALRALSVQKVSHDDLLVNMYLQAKGAINSYESHLEKLTAEREIVEKELEDISERWDANKFAVR